MPGRKCIRFSNIVELHLAHFRSLSRECEEAYPSVPIGGRFVSKLLPDARTLPARRVVFFLGLLSAHMIDIDSCYSVGIVSLQDRKRGRGGRIHILYGETC